MAPLVAGVALGAAGAVANYMGGRSEAKRKKRAIDRYGRESAALYEAMAKDAWDQGSERQRGTGQVISGLIPTMSAPASSAPEVSSFLPAEQPDPSGLRGDAYRQAVMAAGQPQQQLTQAQVEADQAVLDRTALARALDALGFTSGIDAMAQAPAHQRVQWQKRRELEEARARLERALGSIGNRARNLQLLGSLLGTAGQGAMMYGAFGGGPSAGAGGLARDARNAAFFNSFAGAP